MYDLRSDTFTKPSEAMRKAMYSAEVGDDVYGEDPTAEKLQRMAEEITGKERSLIVSSGWEVLTSGYSHIVNHEIGAVASLSGTLPVIVPSEYGIMKAEEIAKHIHGYAYDMSQTAIIETENTTSGIVYPIDELRKIKEIADSHSLWVHMDGARIFNASVETGISVREYAETASDITFCLSKGLGCPAFSILSGDREFIEKAKRVRKLLGGGMRQIGILAAAGIYALENNIQRLKDDHEHRERISSALEKTGWADMKISSTNMIFFSSEYDMDRIVSAFREKGVLFLKEGDMGRIVLSMNISDEDTDAIVKIIGSMDAREFS